jgi:hypothetical protein
LIGWGLNQATVFLMSLTSSIASLIGSTEMASRSGKSRFHALAACAVLSFMSIMPVSGDDSCDEAGYDCLYAGVSASVILPQGGSDMRRLGGATARTGYYVSESLAVEADVSWLEDCVGIGVQGLWHFWGYERFDPFLTVGARGWIDGDVGPVAGLGAFYHLTENWSLRGDAQAVLGIDRECDMIYSISLGVQYAF